ncbi:MAG: hypothetical protein U9O87_06065 [Verrucomicrobiota bacterium]|nr:hypothetical protein [Verrucomicrobiota bacterium]
MLRRTRKRDIHKYTLIQLNSCVYFARRDVAFFRLKKLIYDEIKSASREDRYRFYQLSQYLLSEAVQAGKKAIEDENDSVNEFFFLLSETLGAAVALVKYELVLNEESEKFRKITGDYVGNTTFGKDGFSGSEMNIYYCIEDLMEYAENSLTEDVLKRKKTFTKEEKKRYRIAHSEYRDYYANLKKVKTITMKGCLYNSAFNTHIYPM